MGSSEPRSLPAPDPRPASPAPAAPAEPLARGPLPEGAQVVKIDDELTARRVAKDAYLITHHAGLVPANSLVVRMGDGTLVLCSSPYETEATRALVRWMRGAFRPPRIVAINTHFHPDGTGGNEAFAQEGVETYASDLTQRLLEARGAEVRDQTAAAVEEPLRARLTRMKIVPAARTFNAKEGLTLTFGGESIRVLYPGAAHSPDNVVVFFPAQRLLFGGCMIRAATAKIGYTGDADVERWEAAVRALDAFAPEVVIPGHGDPGGPDLLRHTAHLAREAADAQRLKREPGRAP